MSTIVKVYYMCRADYNLDWSKTTMRESCLRMTASQHDQFHSVIFSRLLGTRQWKFYDSYTSHHSELRNAEEIARQGAIAYTGCSHGIVKGPIVDKEVILDLSCLVDIIGPTV